MGNLENLKRGEVQFTSAGTGIRHSEYNRNTDSEVHFLQIWAKPNKRGLKPHYETKKFTDEEKTDKLVRIMEYTDRLEKSKGAIGLQADLSMDASILSPGKTVVHELVAEGPRKLFAHVVMGGRSQPKQGGAQIKIGDTVLGEGDGAYIEGGAGPSKVEIESVGEKPAEFLLFDMGSQDA
jgi:redox-sensitive bicupin YhaK (pirin superfamily)